MEPADRKAASQDRTVAGAVGVAVGNRGEILEDRNQSGSDCQNPDCCRRHSAHCLSVCIDGQRDAIGRLSELGREFAISDIHNPFLDPDNHLSAQLLCLLMARVQAGGQT